MYAGERRLLLTPPLLTCLTCLLPKPCGGGFRPLVSINHSTCCHHGKWTISFPNVHEIISLTTEHPIMASRRLIAPIPYPPPEHCSTPSRPDPHPSGSQEGQKLQTLLEHFRSDSLQLAEKEGTKETKELEDVEKLYLVGPVL